jgi:hypothetical protein
MKIRHIIGLVAGAAAMTAGLATPAFADTPGPATAPKPTVDSIKARVDTIADHITTKLQALQTRVAAKPVFAAAQASLQADITKTLADTAAWRKQADAATTIAEIRACGPARQTLKDDLAKLKADVAAAKGTTTTSPN